jgi:lipopolysaccharide/colanic/teichoic acid biosynthesis glycosyltransferase
VLSVSWQIEGSQVGLRSPDGWLAKSAGPKRRGYLRCKFFGEWLFAVTLVLLTAPLMVLLAIAVKLTSSGPAFYSQTRLGRFSRPFRIFKLRTMRHDCEAATGAVWSLPGDVRITPLGRLLRNTHLDELPQLWNVLLGQMSLVGPRPERPEITVKIDRVIPNFRDRLTVRPGVTGLAQMRLPADTDMEGVRKKLAHDLYYVREVSFLLDLRIAFSTAFYFMGAACDACHGALINDNGQEVESNFDGEAAVGSLPPACEVEVA